MEDNLPPYSASLKKKYNIDAGLIVDSSINPYWMSEGHGINIFIARLAVRINPNQCLQDPQIPGCRISRAKDRSCINIRPYQTRKRVFQDFVFGPHVAKSEPHGTMRGVQRGRNYCKHAARSTMGPMAPSDANVGSWKEDFRFHISRFVRSVWDGMRSKTAWT